MVATSRIIRLFSSSSLGFKINKEVKYKRVEDNQLVCSLRGVNVRKYNKDCTVADKLHGSLLISLRVQFSVCRIHSIEDGSRGILEAIATTLTGLKPLNIARPVNTAHPKTIVYKARPMSYFLKLAQSTVKRPYQSRTALTNKNFNQKVNTAKEKVYTAKPKAVNTVKPKAVNTARPTSAVVNAVRANQVNAIKASACWVWIPTKLNSASITFKRQNYIDA
ncbi:hypothetical protein Tco_0960224 [Tanacetum coccineum]